MVSVLKTEKPWPGLVWSWRDAAAEKTARFMPSQSAERMYERQLKSVAGQVRHIIATDQNPETMQRRLREYAQAITPWAEQAATNMMAAVNRKNEQVWKAAAGKISAGMRKQLSLAVDGLTVSEAIRWNVNMIKNLPEGAASKIAELTETALVSGLREEEVYKKIMSVGDICETRARTIARTEISKANTALTQARAASVGSEGYIWRTSRDGDVRDSHAAMEGKFVKWSEPPTLDGFAAHAGECVNCRCYPEPVIPQETEGRTYESPLPTEVEVRKDPQKGLLSSWEVNNKQIVQHKEGDALPGVRQASFDMRKASAYALNMEHPVGRHKAAVFKDILGMGQEHADMLRDQVMTKLADLPAVRKGSANGAKGTDRDGERFTVHVPVTGPNGKTIEVTTAWIYDRQGKQAQSQTPRMISLFIDDKTLKAYKKGN